MRRRNISNHANKTKKFAKIQYGYGNATYISKQKRKEKNITEAIGVIVKNK